VIRPDEIVAEAKLRAPGMMAFFILVGSAVRNDRSRVAFDLLVDLGLSRARAWQLVEGWEATEGRERQTGWTAEAAAIGAFMNDVPGWPAIDWEALAKALARTAGPNLGPGGRTKA
jgi:hypothetical protein